MDADVIIIGAGVVGAALAYGIARKGHKVMVFDGEDRDFRAARANFGLVWVQGKGSGMPAYTDLTLQSASLWPDFRQELAEVADARIDYSRKGGLVFCMSEADYKARAELIERTHNRPTEVYTEMVERPALERMLPAITLGRDVIGASYCKLDGHTNPLQLYAALLRASAALGVRIGFRNPVKAIRPLPDGFHVEAREGDARARRVIVASGPWQRPA